MFSLIISAFPAFSFVQTHERKLPDANKKLWMWKLAVALFIVAIYYPFILLDLSLGSQLRIEVALGAAEVLTGTMGICITVLVIALTIKNEEGGAVLGLGMTSTMALTALAAGIGNILLSIALVSISPAVTTYFLFSTGKNKYKATSRDNILTAAIQTLITFSGLYLIQKIVY